MKAYALDLRKRVVKFIHAGGSKAEAARRFALGRSTVYRYLDAGQAGTLTAVDFVDNPAMLVEVSDGGLVALNTYQGEVVGPLYGVHWCTNDALLRKARELLKVAQGDKVAFSKSRDGKLRIWYMTESGAESLNEKLTEVFEHGECSGDERGHRP